MKKILTLILILTGLLYGQGEPVMYFCEYYDVRSGMEVGVSDRFTTGYLTIVVKADYPLRLTECSIQFDKYNERIGGFEYYNKFHFVVEPDMNYIYFNNEQQKDFSFYDAGFYRVFLLDEGDRSVASGLVEIIRKDYEQYKR
jgi:hypothetical protein